MKYLKLHTLLWIIICVICLLFTMLYYMAMNLIYFIWCFKFLKWSEHITYDVFIIHKGKLDVDTMADKNPIATFLRFYNGFYNN